MIRIVTVIALFFMGLSAFAAGTATVIRAHPWLTRGVPKESLIGLRFEGAWGGALNGVTFQLALEGCTAADFSNFTLWIQRGPAYAFYESTAVQLKTWSAATVSADGSTLSLTYSDPDYATRTMSDAQWLVRNNNRSDRIWLTAEVNPAISTAATITATVTSSTVYLGENQYTLADAATPPVHRVYPYRYRINAYLRNERLKGATAAVTRDIFDDAPAQRVSTHTDLTSIDLFPIYDSATDTFALSWDRKTVSAGTVSDTIGTTRLRTLRDTYHPKARVHISLTKGRTTLELDSMGNGTLFSTTPLGHAVGDRYRAALVAHIVDLLKTHQLDGLDIDWEYPDPTVADGSGQTNCEYHKYGLLLRDLAEAFFPYGWDLAVCTNQSGWHIPGGDVLAAADFINSMAYGPWANFLGRQIMLDGINVCTSRNVPKRRIVVGQAMYSNGNYQLGWDECARRLATLGYPDAWDCDAYKESWTNTQNGTSGDYYYFTAPSTYRAKCAYVRQEGYGGVMSWGYYSDVAWNHPLSLAKHQAQVIWPQAADPQPPPRASDGVYELDSEEDWQWLCANPGVSARLTANIVFAHDPTPIPSFSGTLDGNGHTLTLPADTWICVFENAALIEALAGTVKNLTVRIEGRILSRADRTADSGPNTTTVTGDGEAAGLVAHLSGSCTLENVRVIVAEGAEIRGVKRAAAVVANAYCSASNTATLTRAYADIAGTICVRATTAVGTNYDPQHTCTGGLIGWFGGPSGSGLTVNECTVKLAPTAVLSTLTGDPAGTGGCIGHVNTTHPTIANLRLRWSDGATLSCNTSGACTPMPWLASYYEHSDSYPKASGKIEANAATFPWETWWLQSCSPLKAPGYFFSLH